MITDKGLKHIANSCSELQHLDLYRFLYLNFVKFKSNL